MNETYVQEYDKDGNKVYKENGCASFILKKDKVFEANTSVITDKKTEKVFHHEAGKGSRRR